MHTLTPIGYIKTPYADKFGVPRQSGLTTHAQAQLTLVAPYNHPDCVRGLESCSHVWLIFQFSHTLQAGWKPLTRPPRLGGNKKRGVFATRTTHRPNALGLSAVELVGIETQNGVSLNLGSTDLVDGTPIFDIKPYLPYADSLTQAQYPEMERPNTLNLPVTFTESAKQFIEQGAPSKFSHLITETLLLDPRPPFHKDPHRIYGIQLAGHEIRFSINDHEITVVSIELIN